MTHQMTHLQFRMVPEITVAEAVVVAHAVEVRRDVVAAKDRTEHNTRLLLKIFPAVASMFFYLILTPTQILIFSLVGHN